MIPENYASVLINNIYLFLKRYLYNREEEAIAKNM